VVAPIVDASWLADHPEAVLADVRWYADGRSGRAAYERAHLPGAVFEYSNLGVGLLGHALALRARIPYEQLVRERILNPLGMTHTAITLERCSAVRSAVAVTTTVIRCAVRRRGACVQPAIRSGRRPRPRSRRRRARPQRWRER